MKPIKLPWMEKIRERRKEWEEKIEDEEIKEILLKAVDAFLKPIIEYGESEEERITTRLMEETTR